VVKVEKILITSALPYVNNVPHLGNIIGCVLSADVFARFCRSRGYETIYVCGTDDYGTATEIKAREEGVTPREITDKYHKIHKEVYDWFGIEFDTFGRTSTQKHTEISQNIFLKLKKNGHILEEEIEQPYDEEAEMFLADRYIEGNCPYCNYEHARADQCEKCGKLLNYNELKKPVSKISKTKPVLKKSKHLFINLPGLEKKLGEWINKTAKEGFWSDNSYNIAKAWLKEGLKKRDITRDMKWGVPVPIEGYDGKVLYVWFEAPIGYISITANFTPAWEELWKNPEKIKLYQFMGKDNVPFHTVIFPSTLMGTEEDWTLLYHINTTEYLNYEGGKFSKSRGTGVFGNDAMKSGIPADVWRYYLLVNRPEQSDSNFTWSDFGDKNNSELLSNLGNLVNRTLVFIQNNFDGVVPDAVLNEKDNEFIEEQNGEYENITEMLEKVKIKEGLHRIMHVVKNSNKYFQENKPWEAVKNDKERGKAVLYVLSNQMKDLAILLEPYLPNTSREIFKQLNIEGKKWDDLGKLSLEREHKIGKPKHIFRKIENAELEKLKKQFSGKQRNEISFKDVDLEVGEILEVEQHPNADKLYIEKVKMGDCIIQIVSGLAEHYKPEELKGKKIVVVKNLKPAKLRGALSQGMLLVAEDGDEIEVIEPKNSKVGEKITKKGEMNTPKKIITINEFSKVEMKVINNKLTAEGKELVTKSEEIKTKIKDGKIS